MLTTTLLTVLALGAVSQPAQDPQWLAFEGCWRAVTEQADGPVVCIRETAGSLLMATYLAGELKSEQRITATGAARAISEGGCTGEETGRWSADGSRIYVRARLGCGTGMERVTTSALALTTTESMVEVQSLRVGDGTSVRSIRYQAASPSEYPANWQQPQGRELAREMARVHAAAVLDVEDVVEASQQIDAAALDALLAAKQSGFALSGPKLRELAAAGVARSTLDMMVALSYPDEFRVAEDAPLQDRRTAWANPYYDPFTANPYYQYDCVGLDYYSSYACDYRYRYGSSPFGYSRYGWNPYGYNRYGGYYGGGGIIIVPVGDDDGQVGQGGSVGPGGYTRGSQPTKGTARPRSEPTTSGSPRSSVSPGSSSGGSSARGGSGSSGGGSVSSGGHSSGGGASKGTAKPRGGGE